MFSIKNKRNTSATAKSSAIDSTSKQTESKAILGNTQPNLDLSELYAPPKSSRYAELEDYKKKLHPLEALLISLKLKAKPDLKIQIKISDETFLEFQKALQKITSSKLAVPLLNSFPAVPRDIEKNVCSSLDDIGPLIKGHHPLLLSQHNPRDSSDSLFLFLVATGLGPVIAVHKTLYTYAKIYRTPEPVLGYNWSRSSALDKNYLSTIIENRIRDCGEFNHLYGLIEITPQRIKKELVALQKDIMEEFLSLCRAKGIGTYSSR